MPARNADPLGFVAGIRGLDPDRHVGFKIFPPHLEAAPGAIAHLAAPATRRIVLTRAPLETYASFLRMQATGVHKLKEGERPPPEALDAKVRFTRKSFRRFPAGYNRFMVMAHLIAAIPGSFVIDYDQINDEAALDALFAFVGSAARAAESSTAFRKQYAGSLEEGFENWDELQAFLKRTGAGPPRPAAAEPSGSAGRLSRAARGSPARPSRRAARRARARGSASRARPGPGGGSRNSVSRPRKRRAAARFEAS